MTEWLSITSIDKAVVFPVVTYGYESWTIKKKCWRRLLRVPWTAKGSNQSIWKEINSEYSLEGLMLKLKLRYLKLPTWSEKLTHWKRPWCWERLRAEGEEGIRGWDGWMAPRTQWTWTWQTSGAGEGQGGLVYCSLCGCEESDTTGQMNNEKPLTVNFWIQENYPNAKIMDFFLSCAISFQGSVNAILLLSFASWKRSRKITFTLENCILDILKTVKCWLYQEPWPSDGICSSLHFKLKFFKKFYFLVIPCGMWDPSSPTRDRTYAPCGVSLES